MNIEQIEIIRIIIFATMCLFALVGLDFNNKCNMSKKDASQKPWYLSESFMPIAFLGCVSMLFLEAMDASLKLYFHLAIATVIIAITVYLIIIFTCRSKDEKNEKEGDE